MTHRIGTVFALLAISATVTVAAPPGTTTFTENFEAGNNTGGWTFGTPGLERIESAGGHPGAYLRAPFLDTFAPLARTTLPSDFSGDYRARGVSAVGVELVLHYVDFSSQDRPPAVLLRNDGGTPEDFADDCTVFLLGTKPAPMPNSLWRSYRFRIPSDSPLLPRGWRVLSCDARDGDEAWNRVIQDVDALSFHVGDPELFYIFQVWDIGLDNPSITFGTPEPALEEGPGGDALPEISLEEGPVEMDRL